MESPNKYSEMCVCFKCVCVCVCLLICITLAWKKHLITVHKHMMSQTN